MMIKMDVVGMLLQCCWLRYGTITVRAWVYGIDDDMMMKTF